MKLNLFLLLCLTGVVSITLQDVRHDYHLITTPATWSDAEIYCRTMYVNLATVKTNDDFERLNAEAERKGLTATGWVGLYDNVNTWHWSIPNQTWSLINWAPGQPDNAGGKESCGAIDSSGYWADYPCTDLKPYICYNAISQTFIAVPNSRRSWWGGQSFCQTHHTDLASATNQTMNNKLQQLVLLQGTSWFGLARKTWTWLDWTETSGLQWSPGFPNNADNPSSCASVNNSLLMDRQCNSRFYFFCHTYYTVRKQVVKLKIQGDKSVFDPAVQSAILQQIVQKLKEHGITREIKVTWRVQPDGNIFHKKSKDGL